MSMTKVLRWWILFLLQAIALFVGYHFGFFEYVWHHDFTKLSFVILTIWLIGTLRVGYLLYQTKKLASSEFPELTLDDDRNDLPWFVSDSCLDLGMIGTVIGFLLMMNSIMNMGGSLTDPVILEKFLQSMSTGLGTSMLTTAFGLTCGRLLKVQAYVLDH